jgi:ATP-dependent helicase/nuclease subunit A
MIPNKPKQSFWSDEQWLAIHASGKNILVNAGAGSGKTAVLTERIVQILKKGIGLDRLIVLTFTKASASEMKERLRKRLSEEIGLGDFNLQTPLDYLDQANIQTFDAFALWLVRKYHYLLGVSRNLDLGDKVVFHTAKKAIIRQILDDRYEANDAGFLALVSLLCQKNDDNLEQFLSDIDEKMDLLPNKDDVLNRYGEYYLTDAIIDKSIEEYLALIRLETSRISHRLKRLKSQITDETMLKHVLDVEEVLSGLLASKNYEQYRENAGVSLPRLPLKCAHPDEKELVRAEKEEIKKTLSSLRDLLVYNQTAEMKTEVVETQKYAQTMVSLVKDLDFRFSAYKKTNSLFGFMDIAKLAIRLVRDFPEVREAIRINTYEILVDEYQDTSDVQDALIAYLEKGNLFVVGDVKQSIYRFRYANPDLFKAKYRLYEQGSAGMVIDLSKNFRSRSEVLKAVNGIFSRVMSDELGGVDYDDSQALKYGNVHYSEIPDRQLQILTYDSENYRLTNPEIEACILASDISKKINEKYLVLDIESNSMRPVQYRDFAILTAEKSQFDLFKKVFESWNLPLDIAKDENILTSREIFAIGNLLKFIWSLTDEAYFSKAGRDSLLGVLRSFLVEAKDSDIFEIFQNDLREGLKSRYPEFWEKCNNIAQNIRNSTTAQILGEIWPDTAFWTS